MSDKAFRIEVGRRLRITARELGLVSAQALGDFLGAQRATVASWIAGRAIPPVYYMRKLSEERGIPLDWIYRGDGSGLSNALYIRLTAAMEGSPVPEVLPEPEPDDESAVLELPLRKYRNRFSDQPKRRRAIAV